MRNNSERNPLDVLRDEEQKKKSSAESFTSYLLDERPDLGAAFIESIFREPPDQLIVDSITAHLKKHVSTHEIIEACRNSKELVVFDTGSGVAVGLQTPGMVVPSPELRSITRFVEEHVGQWIIIPDDGCTIEYSGEWEGEAIYAMPRLVELEKACQGDPNDLLLEIVHALNLEYVDYDPNA